MVTLALDQYHSRGWTHANISSRYVIIRDSTTLLYGQTPDTYRSGIAKYRKTVFFGEHFYLSPQALSGEKYDMKADLWALGILFQEMATLAEKP